MSTEGQLIGDKGLSLPSPNEIRSRFADSGQDPVVIESFIADETASLAERLCTCRRLVDETFAEAAHLASVAEKMECYAVAVSEMLKRSGPQLGALLGSQEAFRNEYVAQGYDPALWRTLLADSELAGSLSTEFRELAGVAAEFRNSVGRALEGRIRA